MCLLVDFTAYTSRLFDLAKREFSQSASCSHGLGTKGWWRQSVNIENYLNFHPNVSDIDRKDSKHQFKQFKAFLLNKAMLYSIWT